MSESTKPASKADELTKTTDKANIDLTEEELGGVSGGQRSMASTSCRYTLTMLGGWRRTPQSEMRTLLSPTSTVQQSLIFPPSIAPCPAAPPTCPYSVFCGR
jgi:hypothetical protein